MASNQKVFYVYESFKSTTPNFLGTLFVENVRGRESYVISKNPTDFGVSERGATSLYRISAYAFLYLIGKQRNQQAIKALTPQA